MKGKEMRKMEIRTLEELFIAKYEGLESENAELRDELDRRMEENCTLREELRKAREFMSEHLSVEKDACGKEGERRLSLSGHVSEWYAFGKEEKKKAKEAIDYALSMGAKDETKEAEEEAEAAEAESPKDE